MGPSNTPASTNAIGGNHNLTKACIGKNAIFGQNDSTIECFFPDVNQASLQMINYPVVLDIEVTDAGTVVAIVTDTNGNNFKCDDASNLSSCQAVSSDRIYIDSADTAQSTSAYQFYEHFNHTIEIDNDKVASNTYPEQDSPARSVGLGNELPNGKKFILWNNSSDGNLYIYPGVSENVGGSSYKINGTISAGYVLGGFEGDLSDFDSYTVYKNASCSGTPSINEQTLENAYTNIVAEIDNDSLNVYEGDYCITFQGTPNNDGQSVTVYQNRLNYMTTVEGNIDPETEENKVTNTISETIPTNLKPTPVWHDFLLTTGTTTFEISKSVSGNQVTGYAFGDEAVFNIEIIASGSTSSSDLFIVDTLSGSVLDWVSTDVSEVVSVTGDTENCIIKDSEIEGNKITVQLSGGILAGEENKCQIVLKTEFKGYGCFTNDTNTIKSHYGALNSENIPLQGSGVTVCSVGLDNLKLEKYILNTGASDYNAITESTTELFHDGDPIFWLIKWKVDPDAELGNEDPQTTSNDAFVLHDVTLQDSMSGLERANVPTVEGSPIDPGDGYIAPWILGNLTGGTNGYIVIR